MNTDLALGAEIVAVPTVRDPDGLALSSRNAGLTGDERSAALGLHAGLALAVKLRTEGETNAEVLREAIRTKMSKRGVRVDYVSISDPQTLDELDDLGNVSGPALALVAGFVGETRLIDNMAL
jgi:pantoate--beta-alanine ligase